jgi:hypothetical protein
MKKTILIIIIAAVLALLICGCGKTVNSSDGGNGGGGGNSNTSPVTSVSKIKFIVNRTVTGNYRIITHDGDVEQNGMPTHNAKSNPVKYPMNIPGADGYVDGYLFTYKDEAEKYHVRVNFTYGDKVYKLSDLTDSYGIADSAWGTMLDSKVNFEPNTTHYEVLLKSNDGKFRVLEYTTSPVNEPAVPIDSFESADWYNDHLLLADNADGHKLVFYYYAHGSRYPNVGENNFPTAEILALSPDKTKVIYNRGEKIYLNDVDSLRDRISAEQIVTENSPVLAGKTFRKFIWTDNNTVFFVIKGVAQMEYLGKLNIVDKSITWVDTNTSAFGFKDICYSKTDDRLYFLDGSAINAFVKYYLPNEWYARTFSKAPISNAASLTLLE